MADCFKDIACKGRTCERRSGNLEELDLFGEMFVDEVGLQRLYDVM